MIACFDWDCAVSWLAIGTVEGVLEVGCASAFVTASPSSGKLC